MTMWLPSGSASVPELLSRCCIPPWLQLLLLLPESPGSTPVVGQGRVAQPRDLGTLCGARPPKQCSGGAPAGAEGEGGPMQCSRDHVAQCIGSRDAYMASQGSGGVWSACRSWSALSCTADISTKTRLRCSFIFILEKKYSHFPTGTRTVRSRSQTRMLRF